VAQKGRPVFLKMVYHGPQAMEELFRYDPHLVIGILGGSSGTTYDAFKLLAEAQKYGAKAALFGRKINSAENQFAFIRFLRLIADGVISPEEAVRAYHGVLQRLGVRPTRSLEEDMVLQTGVMSYGGSATTTSLPGVTPGGQPTAAPASTSPPAGYKITTSASNVATTNGSTNGASASAKSACSKDGKTCGCGCKKNGGKPEFSKMTSEQRLAYHRQRIAKILGER
jgi:hypothetical protein